MNRIRILCSYLDSCATFADVGCDHGYCTQYMLKNGLCKSAQISDISEKCLDKAKSLLSEYIAEGTVKPVLCAGLEKIDESTDEVLIAGMGGDEIVGILKNSFIPNRFVLQPMRAVRAVREYLLSQNAEITVDEPFEAGGKYYFVLKGSRHGNKCGYTEIQLEYGLNLSSAATRGYLQAELGKKIEYLKRPLNARTRALIAGQAEEIQEILKNGT